MPIVNRDRFFKTTLTALGLKEVTEGGQSYFVSYVNVPEFEGSEKYDHEKTLSASRKAAFAALSKKLDLKQPPVFTETDLTELLTTAFEMNCAMSLLASLELTCLAQAIVDDDRATVKAMLDKKPELLLFKRDVIVTSEYTGQRFGVDGNFLGLACRRKQIEMVKILTPYFDKLQAVDEQNEEIAAIKNAGLSQWLKYKTDANGEIQIPANYQASIDELINLFKAENIEECTIDFRTLSENIETAMEALYNRLIPDFKEGDISKRHVFSMQNHLDVELLLYAAYKAYETHFHSFKTWERRDAYSIRVIGILQNFLLPETAKIFCEGLYYVVEENRAVSDKAAGLKLKDGTSFYSGSDFALRAGLGFKFLAGGGGWRQAVPMPGWTQRTGGVPCGAWETYVKQKQQCSENYTTPRTAPNTTGPRT